MTNNLTRKSVSEAYPELYHYTGITGLKGIIESQTLWATHYAFLNDAEEIIHFRGLLAKVLNPIVGAIVREYASRTDVNRLQIDQRGGVDRVSEETTNDFVRIAYRKMLGDRDNPSLAEPYVVSFCTPDNKREKDHGLLSQWRGYSKEGGYAIVFDTQKIHELLLMEVEKWDYDQVQIADIVYSSATENKVQEEFGKGLDDIKCSIKKLLINPRDPQPLEAMYEPILKYSCRYKHWGFEEEKEVRIIAIPKPPEVRRMAEANGLSLKPEKPKKHFVRRGTTVPYIDLFEDVSVSSRKRLPIKHVIVGPHPEKDQRRRAIEILLQQYGIDAKVSASEIPYIG